MTAPREPLAFEATQRAAWDRLWRKLLAEPPVMNDPAPDRDRDGVNPDLEPETESAA